MRGRGGGGLEPESMFKRYHRRKWTVILNIRDVELFRAERCMFNFRTKSSNRVVCLLTGLPVDDNGDEREPFDTAW